MHSTFNIVCCYSASRRQCSTLHCSTSELYAICLRINVILVLQNGLRSKCILPPQDVSSHQCHFTTCILPPQEKDGWLSSGTMDSMRAVLAQHVHEAGMFACRYLLSHPVYMHMGSVDLLGPR